MRREYTSTIASVNKKSDEETSTRLRRTRSTEEIIMVIFCDKSSIVLTEHLSDGTTISGPYYTALIERLCCVVLKKYGDKVSDGVLLVDDNASVLKCNIIHGALGKNGFVELNNRSYSSGIASSDYYLLDKFLRSKNFSDDDETIDIVEEYLTKLDGE